MTFFIVALSASDNLPDSISPTLIISFLLRVRAALVAPDNKEVTPLTISSLFNAILILT